ncbi:uncharacterized protein [Temnothorax longispinosus]|uniref:uncharacterized protein n=1 Tax=Temnothorax longispinosus TaxID=300112 RepID=UPI003A99C588
MAMNGSPPSKKKKLCKDVGSSSEEASSEEEANQSTTPPKKSQEKLSARHSGSSSQEQTPQPETSRSQTFAAQTPPKDLQETEPSTSAGTSEETIELGMCPLCEQPLTKETLYLHLVMGEWLHWPRRKPTPSPTSSAQTSPEHLQEQTPQPETSRSQTFAAQTPPKDLQETEPSTSARTEQTRYPGFPPSFVITALIYSLRTYRGFVEHSQQTPSAGTLRTSEETEELHTCPKCKKSFTSILSLIYHLLKIHYKSKSPSQEQSPSAQTSQPSTSQPSTSQPSTSQPSTSQPISPAEDLSTIDLINELIKLLETYRREIEHSPSAGTSRTSEETEESHTCSKCGDKFKSIFVLAFHLLFKHDFFIDKQIRQPKK